MLSNVYHAQNVIFMRCHITVLCDIDVTKHMKESFLYNM